MEIYNENVVDLLGDSSSNLEVREDGVSSLYHGVKSGRIITASLTHFKQHCSRGSVTDWPECVACCLCSGGPRVRRQAQRKDLLFILRDPAVRQERRGETTFRINQHERAQLTLAHHLQGNVNERSNTSSLVETQ